MRYFVGLLICIIIISGCKSGEQQGSKDSFISIQESACEGDCPVYTFEIFRDGKSNFEGKLNVNKIGEFYHQFSDIQISKLFDLIDAIDFSIIETLYDSKIADLPETLITFNNKKVLIKDINSIPPNLTSVILELKNLIRQKKYIK